mgnify:CR=1 FL=1
MRNVAGAKVGSIVPHGKGVKENTTAHILGKELQMDTDSITRANACLAGVKAAVSFGAWQCLASVRGAERVERWSRAMVGQRKACWGGINTFLLCVGPRVMCPRV